MAKMVVIFVKDQAKDGTKKIVIFVAEKEKLDWLNVKPVMEKKEYLVSKNLAKLDFQKKKKPTKSKQWGMYLNLKKVRLVTCG